MKRLLPFLLAATCFAGVPVLAQDAAPEISFTSAQPLQLPAGTYFGEVAGVATDSKGNVFVYTRTGYPTATLGGSRTFVHGGSRLFEFDKTGKYVREIGKNSYGFMVAEQVRVDPQDNIWVVDQMTNMVIKFDPTGQVAMLLGRKPESVNVPQAPAAGAGGAAAGGGGGGAGRGPVGAGAQQDVFNRPTDVAWDKEGNIFVADGNGNARVAKFTKDGVFVKSWGSKGAEQGQFNQARSIQLDAAGNVYVADRGNKRIQVFDNNGTFKSQITNVGDPAGLCMTSGAHQYLYSSNSNPVNDIETGGEIYKLELDGKIVGKFGTAGKQAKEFGTVNEIDCRNANQLYVAEIGNYRVQKLTLK